MIHKRVSTSSTIYKSVPIRKITHDTRHLGSKIRLGIPTPRAKLPNFLWHRCPSGGLVRPFVIQYSIPDTVFIFDVVIRFLLGV